MDASQLHEAIEEAFTLSGRRYSSGRRAVIAQILHAGKPLTSNEIAASGGLAQSSTYRSLGLMESMGIVFRIPGDDDNARYELADAFGDHHHHAVCRNCGRIADIKPSTALEQALAAVDNELQTKESFVVEGHRVDITGLCRNCS